MTSVSVFNAQSRHRLPTLETARMVRRVLKGESCARAEIAVVFVDDKRMVELNARFLNKRRPTDVLSFLMEEGTGRRMEGEIYVDLDQARRQAKEYRVTIPNELARLVVHGTLHLLGYDDATPGQQKRMKSREEFYLAKFFNKRS